MKTTNISKTKAWFRSLFMGSSHEMDCAYSTTPGVCTGPKRKCNGPV